MLLFAVINSAVAPNVICYMWISFVFLLENFFYMFHMKMLSNNLTDIIGWLRINWILNYTLGRLPARSHTYIHIPHARTHAHRRPRVHKLNNKEKRAAIWHRFIYTMCVNVGQGHREKLLYCTLRCVICVSIYFFICFLLLLSPVC